MHLKRHRVRARAAGLSLVEMMVGIVVGLLVLWGMSAVYVNAARGGRTTNLSNQLNQDLRAVMDIMANDIRRAGFSAAGLPPAENPFTTATTLPVLSNLGDCIAYSYDATYANVTAGVTAPADFFGFRLGTNGAVQTLDQAGPPTPSDTATVCNNSAWQDVTDVRSIEITELTFDTGGSQCVAFIPKTYNSNAGPPFAWVTDPGTKGRACAPSASNAPSPYPDTTTHAFVETRQVGIVLRGRSRIDPTIENEIRETVLVRNNRVILPP
jgi:type II secretory pathway component PulJ